MHSPWDELVELPGYDAWKLDNERAPEPAERDEDERHEREIACDR